MWIGSERASQSKVERIVTIAYLSLVKINRALNRDLDNYMADWVALPNIKALAFDHNLIIKEAITYIRQYIEFNPSSLFDLLPPTLLRHNFVLCMSCCTTNRLM